MLKPTKPLRLLRKVVDGKVRCCMCREWKPLSDYYQHVRKRYGTLAVDSRCDPCRRASVIAHKMGMTVIEYLERIRGAKGCAICGGGGKLFVDHDHVTGRVRGMLCPACNSMLGQARDSAEVLRKAAEYLEAAGRRVGLKGYKLN